MDTRTSTFANLGIDLSGVNSINLALSKAGLDYAVDKAEIYRKYEGREIVNPEFVETYRMTDGHSYGIVSKNYGIVQNVEAFDFVNYINAPIEFVKGGETKSGMVYVISKLDEMDILGDKFTPYVLFRNSFNGKYALSACICPLRIVCQNQFNISFKETNNTINIRHTIKASEKMAQAQIVLADTVKYLDTLKKEAERYAGMKVSPSQLSLIVDSLFPIKEGMSDRQKDVITNKIVAFKNALASEDNRNFKGSGWAIINAMTDTITHEAPVRKTETGEENRFISVTFDPKIMEKVLYVVNSIAA